MGWPLSVRVRAPAVRLVVSIGRLKVTSSDETGVFRVAGATGAIELTVIGFRTWTVCWAAAGVGWTLPAWSVATL